MDIKVLGTGCPKCNKLEKMVNELVDELKVEASVSKVKDVNEIAKTGVMLTPALMIDGDIKFAGKLPSREDLAALIKAK